MIVPRFLIVDEPSLTGRVEPAEPWRVGVEVDWRLVARMTAGQAGRWVLVEFGLVVPITIGQRARANVEMRRRGKFLAEVRRGRLYVRYDPTSGSSG